MKRIGIVIFLFPLVGLVLMAVFGSKQDGALAQTINGTQVPLTGESLKPFYPDGFYYHDDNRRDPIEQDPVFAVWGEKVIKLVQTADGWNYEEVGLAFLRQYSDLKIVGQISSFMNYQYYPRYGEIRLADGTIVKKYLNEYDPPYWVWAWNSFMFMKNATLHVFVIYPDGTFKDLPAIPVS